MSDNTNKEEKKDVNGQAAEDSDLELIEAGIFDLIPNSPPLGSVGRCSCCGASYRAVTDNMDVRKAHRNGTPCWIRRKKCPGCRTGAVCFLCNDPEIVFKFQKNGRVIITRNRPKGWSSS